MTYQTALDVIRNQALSNIDPDSPTLWQDIFHAGLGAALDILEQETFITSTEKELIRLLYITT